ncbi:metalloprotease family M48X [Achlya hypogyna]|uniref:Metalloprotease family M48X n=1 Tax=Achlya hypogyna TaxID=1202772 RepID=A0A1V9YNI9_ACHHY|nr:metalloprotease family M48X [Achlya hypogyna]
MSALPLYVRASAVVGSVAAAAFGGYVYSHVETVPGTGRRRLMLMSQNAERRLGEQSFRDILRQHSGAILPRSDPRSKMVRAVGERLAKASDRPDFKWEFVVIDSPEPNAFCLPGGKICVYTGLFKLLRHQDGLAAVLSHEVAHALARHSAEQISVGSLFSMFLLLLSPEAGTLATSAFKLVVDLPKSREHESEADAIGLELMAKACYDPRASPEQMFADWARMDGHKALKYFSTHPPSAERAAELQKQLQAPLTHFHRHCADVRRHFP